MMILHKLFFTTAILLCAVRDAQCKTRESPRGGWTTVRKGSWGKLSMQVAQLQRDRRASWFSVMHAFLSVLATIVLEFRIFSHKRFILSKML